MIKLSIDPSRIESMAGAFAAAGKKAPVAVRRAVAHTGDKARNRMRQVLVPQTGLTRRTINKAVRSSRSGGDYVIRSSGGDVRLMFFKPRETRKGVSAAPWNQRRVYPATETVSALNA